MRRQHTRIGLVLATLWAAFACDRVDYRDAWTLQPASQDSAHALLLDFTGQLCGNCPTGHDKADTLSKLYGDHLIVIGVHCSYFAEPMKRPDSAYAFDFRTDIGNEWDDRYGAGSAGLPRGIVNGKPVLLTPSAWPTALAAALAVPPPVTLSMRYANGYAYVKAIASKAYPEDLKLSLYVLRDSMPGWQKDYRLPTTDQNIRSYYQRHVLRFRASETEAFLPSGYVGIKSGSFSVPFATADKPWRNEVVATLSNPSGEIVQVVKARAGSL